MDCPKTTGSGMAGLMNATVWSIERTQMLYVHTNIYVVVYHICTYIPRTVYMY